MGLKGAALLPFLTSIWQSGRVQLTCAPFDPLAHSAGVRELLQEMGRYRRLELPGNGPPLDLPSAEWAAGMLFAASQFLVFRDVPADVVAERLAQLCPSALSPSACYSVDLTFAALPDLISLARGIAVNDPLTVGLIALATQWPLSSVGVAEVATVEIDAFIDDECLARVYVDRVIQKRDIKRLDHPRVRRLASEAIGPYAELAPLVASEIKGDCNEST